MEKRFCSCEKCRECCSNIPGVFKPNEIIEAAKLLNMAAKEFMNKYCIKGWRKGIYLNDGNSYDVEFVYPIVKDCALKMEDYDYPLEGGECKLFIDNKCFINNAKPFECQMTFGCEPMPKNNPKNAALIEWTKEDNIPQEIKEWMEEIK